MRAFKFFLLMLLPVISQAQFEPLPEPYDIYGYGQTPSYYTSLNAPESTYTVLISPTLNNGGFETAGAGGFALWNEATGGGSKITDTVYNGSHAIKLSIDASGSGCNATQPILTTGRVYTMTFTALCSTPGVQITVGTNIYVPMTSTFTTYTVRFTASGANVYISGANAGANGSYFIIDDVTLTEITPVVKNQYLPYAILSGSLGGYSETYHLIERDSTDIITWSNADFKLWNLSSSNTITIKAFDKYGLIGAKTITGVSGVTTQTISMVNKNVRYFTFTSSNPSDVYLYNIIYY